MEEYSLSVFFLYNINTSNIFYSYGNRGMYMEAGAGAGIMLI